MRTTLFVLAALVAGAFGGWEMRAHSQKDVRPAQGFFLNDRLDDAQFPYLVAKGTWRGADLANKINTVRILCDAGTKSCEATQADVLRLIQIPLLSLDFSNFRITKLDASSLIAEAVSSGPCIRVVLTVDRVAKAVTFARTKISNTDACSIVQNEPVTLFLGDPPT